MSARDLGRDGADSPTSLDAVRRAGKIGISAEVGGGVTPATTKTARAASQKLLLYLGIQKGPLFQDTV